MFLRLYRTAESMAPVAGHGTSGRSGNRLGHSTPVFGCYTYKIPKTCRYFPQLMDPFLPLSLRYRKAPSFPICLSLILRLESLRWTVCGASRFYWFCCAMRSSSSNRSPGLTPDVAPNYEVEGLDVPALLRKRSDVMWWRFSSEIALALSRNPLRFNVTLASMILLPRRLFP